MLKIKFYPDSDTKDLQKSVQRYREIWKKDGGRIVEKVEEITGLKFKESFINAVVFLAKLPSRSYPLSLKANVSDERKLALLIHELCHRNLASNRVGLLRGSKFKSEKERIFQIHKILNLVLYDIWHDLYGKEFAKKQVLVESASERVDIYKKAWQLILSKTKKERAKMFLKIKKQSKPSRKELSRSKHIPDTAQNKLDKKLKGL